jgi:hypothetical protein
MMLGLLWIVGSYAIGIALVHWCYRRDREKSQIETHVALITYNSQLQVEWFVRSLLFFSRLKGKEIQLTVADEGSTDDTLAIVEKLRLEHSLNISLIVERGSFEEWKNTNEDNRMIVVRLGHQEDLVTACKTL